MNEEEEQQQRPQKTKLIADQRRKRSESTVEVKLDQKEELVELVRKAKRPVERGVHLKMTSHLCDPQLHERGDRISFALSLIVAQIPYPTPFAIPSMLLLCRFFLLREQ